LISDCLFDDFSIGALMDRQQSFSATYETNRSFPIEFASISLFPECSNNFDATLPVGKPPVSQNLVIILT
jgi:hypothetical protein